MKKFLLVSPKNRTAYNFRGDLIRDIRAKCLRSNNPQNVVAATFEGLKSLRGPAEVARIRGKSVEEIVG